MNVILQLTSLTRGNFSFFFPLYAFSSSLLTFELDITLKNVRLFWVWNSMDGRELGYEVLMYDVEWWMPRTSWDAMSSSIGLMTYYLWVTQRWNRRQVVCNKIIVWFSLFFFVYYYYYFYKHVIRCRTLPDYGRNLSRYLSYYNTLWCANFD